MARITWNESGKRFYRAGVDRGVFYPREGVAVPWNGLVSVADTPSSSSEARYFDGQKYYSDSSEDSFAGTIEAYTYPDRLTDYDGSRRPFDFSFRTHIRNDLGQEDYEIHLVYNARVSEASRVYSSLADIPDPLVFSWDFTTTPVLIPNLRPSSHLYISSTTTRPETMRQFESILYGSEGRNAQILPMVQLMELFESLSVLYIIDHGDGTWTASGPDDVVRQTNYTEFEIEWPSAVYLDEYTYQISTSKWEA